MPNSVGGCFFDNTVIFFGLFYFQPCQSLADDAPSFKNGCNGSLRLMCLSYQVAHINSVFICLRKRRDMAYLSRVSD